MKAFKKLMDYISGVEKFALVVVFIIITVITFVNVLSRFVFHASLSWSEEIVINIATLLTMLGCARCTREGTMITLSLVFDNVGVTGKKILSVIATIASFAFYGILIKTGFAKVATQMANGKATFSLGWPEWWFTILLPIGSIFILLHAVEFMLDVLTGNAACVKEASKEEKA